MNKHISLDFWNTLAAPNSVYSLMRTDFLRSLTGFTVPYDVVVEKYIKVKHSLDENALKGVATTSENSMSLLLHELGVDNITDNRFVITILEQLFLSDSPYIRTDITANLMALKNSGYRFCITSNTNFISGEVIKVYLERNLLSDAFEGMFFSDEVGVTKPHSKIFQCVHDLFGVDKSEITHIGDNQYTDYYGAKEFGFDSILVNNPNSTADILIDLIKGTY